MTFQVPSNEIAKLLDSRIEIHLEPFVHFSDEVADAGPTEVVALEVFEVGVGHLANCVHLCFCGFGSIGPVAVPVKDVS